MYFQETGSASDEAQFFFEDFSFLNNIISTNFSPSSSANLEVLQDADLLANLNDGNGGGGVGGFLDLSSPSSGNTTTATTTGPELMQQEWADGNGGSGITVMVQSMHAPATEQTVAMDHPQVIFDYESAGNFSSGGGGAVDMMDQLANRYEELGREGANEEVITSESKIRAEEAAKYQNGTNKKSRNTTSNSSGKGEKIFTNSSTTTHHPNHNNNHHHHPLICRVCGDKALGYNFNVVTCESCKAFFRRNALKKKTTRCPSANNNCSITVSTRRQCQKCRLRKCFEVGMKPEYIMTEKQRAEKRKRLLAREFGELQQESNANWSVPLNIVNNNHHQDQQHQDEISGSSEDADSSGSEQQQQQQQQQQLETKEASIKDIGIIDNSFQITINSGTISNTTSPIESMSTPTTSSAGVSGDLEQVEITIRMPKSKLLDILRNNPSTDGGTGSAQQQALAPALVSCFRVPSCGDTASSTAVRDGYFNASPAMVDELQAATIGSHIQQLPPQQGIQSTSPLNIVREPFLQTSPPPLSASFIEQPPLSSITTSSCQEFSPPSSASSYTMDRTLYAKLEELRIVDSHYIESPPQVDARLDAQSFASMMYTSSRRTIKQFSELSAFKKLSLVDQQTLLKHNSDQLGILRVIQYYDKETDSLLCKIPRPTYVPLGVITNRIRGGIYEQTKELINSYADKWRQDASLMLILRAVAIFNPNLPPVSNKNAVESSRRVYLQLLKKYLEYTYGDVEGRWAYEYLSERIDNLATWVKQYSARVVFDFAPNTLEISFFEVLDFV